MKGKGDPKKKSAPKDRNLEAAKSIQPVLDAIEALQAQINGAHLSSTEDLNRRAQALTVLTAVDNILRALCESSDSLAGYYYYNFASDS